MWFPALSTVFYIELERLCAIESCLQLEGILPQEGFRLGLLALIQRAVGATRTETIMLNYRAPDKMGY